MKKTFSFLFLFISLSVLSQNKPKEQVEKFFTQYQEQSATVAIDNLYKTNQWMDRATDAITDLKIKMEGLNTDFVGKFYGYELILEKKLGESFILLSYLGKYDRQPIRFTFEFYKPNDTWKIFGLKFDGDLDNEIEEAAKLYYHRLDD